MKKLSLALAAFFLTSSLYGAEAGIKSAPPAAVGGGVFLRYLHLNLSRWEDARGGKLKDQDLAVTGGRCFASGPVAGSQLRWRLGGFLGWSTAPDDDDIDKLQLGLVTGGLTSGLTWQPGLFGLSADLNCAGSGIMTEVKRRELSDDWDEYERRYTALLFLEPLLGCNFRLSDIFLIRLQGGYSFLWGRGEQVGGFSAGLAFEVGRWL